MSATHYTHADGSQEPHATRNVRLASRLKVKLVSYGIPDGEAAEAARKLQESLDAETGVTR